MNNDYLPTESSNDMYFVDGGMVDSHSLELDSYRSENRPLLHYTPKGSKPTNSMRDFTDSEANALWNYKR